MLKSISKELIICKKEKDEFRQMVEQLGEKCSLMKRRIEKLNSLRGEDEMNFGSVEDYNQIVLSQNYKKLQDSNKLLNFELNDLRIKLADAESDTRLLREKIAKLKRRNQSSDQVIDHIESGEHSKSQHLIEQIEKLRMNNKQLQKDLKMHLDEKEDLVKSRNSYIQKAERLNERLNGLMKGEAFGEGVLSGTPPSTSRQPDRFLDIDSILSENSFLKERLKCLEEDKRFNQEQIVKYKHALDKSSSKKPFFEPLSNLTHKKSAGSSTNYPLNQDIISTRQLQSFIASNNLDNLEPNEASLAHLRKLVLALFESVSDKTAALSLAKTNNKLLGARINDLEAKLKEYENKQRHQRLETFRLSESGTGGLDSDFDDDKLEVKLESKLQLEQKLDHEGSDRKQERRHRSESGSIKDLETDEANRKGTIWDLESDKKQVDELDSERDVNENIRDRKNENSQDQLDSGGLISLPYNLQKLVEQELNKLKDDE